MNSFLPRMIAIVMIVLGMGCLATPAQAKGVLFIGDSHVPGPFGLTLDSLLRSNLDLSVETYGVCAAIAHSFLAPYETSCGYYFHVLNDEPATGLTGPAPVLQSVLASMKPELTVIELGTNYVSDEDTNIVADMSKLVKTVKAAGSACVWISMPDTRKFRDRQAAMIKDTQDAVGTDCKMIDSTALTHYPDAGGDGIHYQSAGELKPIGIAWANQVYEQIKSLLPAP